MIYPLAYSTWGKEELEAIQRVCDSDMYTMGKHVKQFENEFADVFGQGATGRHLHVQIVHAIPSGSSGTRTRWAGSAYCVGDT